MSKTNIKCAHTAVVKLADLKPFPNNENKHSEKQVQALAKIIKKLGQRSPIIVSNRSGYITKGHGRLEAIKSLGWDECAVDFQDYKNDIEELNDRVADNEIARYAEFQRDMFIDNLGDLDLEIDDLDLEEFGILDLDFDFDTQDYSDRNKEIDMSEMDTNGKICFEFSSDKYLIVLNKISDLKEKFEIFEDDLFFERLLEIADET